MPNSIYQASFSRGEIAPHAQGRVDLAAFQNGLGKLRNFLVKVTGGTFNRPGTSYVCELFDSTQRGRLIPFQFSTTQGYALVFEDELMRVVKDGGQVLFSSGPNIGDPFEVVSPYTAAQLPNVKYTQLNDVMTLVHGSVIQKQLSRTAHDAWTFTNFAAVEGPFQDIAVDRTVGVTAVGASFLVGATVTIHSSDAIFAAANVGQLFYMEQKNFGVPWEVAKAVTAGDVRRSEGRYYEALNSATTGTLRPTGQTPGDVESDGAVNWEYIHSGYGIVRIATFVDANTVTATVMLRLPAEVTGPELTITGAADNGSGLIRITSNGHGYANNDTVLIYDVGGTVEANGLWIVVGQTANTFDLKGSVFATTYTSGGKAVKSGTYKYAFGAWGGDQGYPDAVTYFQQRQWFAILNRLDFSAINAFTMFGKSTPLADDDAGSMRLVSNQVNAVRHLVGLKKLIAFTAGGKFVIPDPDQDTQIITPSQRSASDDPGVGSSDVRPVSVKDAIIYAVDKGQAVEDVAYQFGQNSWSGNELSVLSSHLLEGHEIVAQAYQHTPFRAVWIVRDDGVLLTLIYLKEHQVAAWAWQDTEGLFEDVCVVSEPPEDAVYFIVNRTIEGVTKRYVERLHSRMYSDIVDAIFLDSSLTYDGRNTGATTMTLTSSGATYEYDSGEVFTLSSSASFFMPGHVNDEIHFKDFTVGEDEYGQPIEVLTGLVLRAKIVEYLNATQARVTLNRDCPVVLQATARTEWGLAQQAFSGLDHLEGKNVGVFADGFVVANPNNDAYDVITVEAGAVSLDRCYVVVHIGLSYNSDFQTLDMNVLGQETIRDKQKIVNAVTLLCEESRGIFAGPTFDDDDLIEYPQRNEENYDEPVSLLTGQAEVHIKAKWGVGGRVCVRQKDPIPLSILAAIPQVTIGG